MKITNMIFTSPTFYKAFLSVTFIRLSKANKKNNVPCSLVVLFTLLSGIFILSGCNKQAKPVPPFPENQNNQSQPTFITLEQKPKYKPAELYLRSKHGFSKPVYTSSTPDKITPDQTNLQPVKKKPVKIEAGLPQQVKNTKLEYRKIRSKYIIAEMPQKIKASTQPMMKDNAIRNIRYFNIDQGLPGTTVTALLNDHMGRIWIGTKNGLAIYDGTYFYYYTIREGLSSNFISSLLEDKEGRIWIGTSEKGVNVFDGKGFNHYTTEDGLTNNNITSLLEDKQGRIWVGTFGGGINVFNDKKLTLYSEKEGFISKYVSALLEDNRGRVWIATSNDGLYMCDQENFIHYTIEQGLSHNVILSLEEDNKGNLWIGTLNGLNVFDGNHFTLFTSNEGLLGNYISGLREDHLGRIWIGCKEGVSIYDGEKFIHYTQAEGLNGSFAQCILEDHQNQLWVGTLDGGVNVIGDQGFRHYLSYPGFNTDHISCLLQDSAGRIWIGTKGNGIMVYNEKKFEHYTLGIQSPVSSFVEDREKRIWMFHSTGISIYDGKRFANYDGLIKGSMPVSLKDKQGNIWIGTNGGGLYKFDGKDFTNYSITDKPEGIQISSLLEDSKGRIWIGTNGEGLFVYDGIGFSHYTTYEGLSSNNISCFVEDETQRIWIGTLGDGINIFDEKKIIHFTTDQGLCNNNIFSLLKDSLNRIWAGTGQGLSCFIKNKNGSFAIQNSRKRQGLYNLSFNSNAALLDREGKFWWAADNVLSTYIPPVKADKTSPLACFTQIDLMGKPVQWLTPEFIYKNLPEETDTIWHVRMDTFFLASHLPADTSWLKKAAIHYDGIDEPYNLPTHLRLPYNKNWLSFYFTGIRLKDFAEIRYRYFLQGFDEEWSAVTDHPQADYRNIPPGHYTFMVRARCRNSVWSCAIEYPFDVLPPWWQTPWAYSGYSLGIICLMLGFARWRTDKLKKDKISLEQIVDERTTELMTQKEEVVKQKEQTRLKRNLHDSLGGVISALKLNISLLDPDVDYRKNKKEVFECCIKLVDEAYADVRELTSDNSLEEYVKTGFLRIVPELLTRAESVFNYKTKFVTDINEDALSTDKKINLYMIFKEAINNTIKHSQGKNIILRLVKTENIIEAIIMDDGHGFDVSTAMIKGNGLRNIRNRVTEMNGKLTVISDKDEGTVLRMEFPL